MSDITALVAGNLDLWTSATQRKSGAGRGGGKRISLYGIERLRALILDLAVRGKLVPQDAGDEPAAALLPKMAAERQRRIKAGEIRAAKGPAKPSSEPFDLPSGWVWLPVWQTGNIFTGNSINSSLRAELETNSEGRPFVATKDVGYGLDPIDYDNGLTVTLDDQRFNVARPNSVFICAEGGSAGRKMAISDREISFGNKLISNEPWSQIEPRFILFTYLSDFFFDCFAKEMTGIIGGISRAKFLALPFPLPPLAEQQRIVAKVDELMALCDALERESAGAMAAHTHLVEELLATLVNSATPADLATNWARLESHFDTLFTTDVSIEALKQTILDLAVRGKLVEQDAGDEEARVILKNVKTNKATLIAKKKIRKIPDAVLGIQLDQLFNLPGSWAWAPLGELVSILGDGLHGTPNYDPSGECYFINGNNLIDGNILIKSETKRVSIEQYDKHKKHLNDNTVLVSINGTIGNVAFFKNEIVILGKSACYFNLMEGISKQYVLKIIKSRHFLNYAHSQATGSTIKNVSLKTMRELPLPLPPLAEQHRIVAKVDALMALCNQLKTRLADAAQTQRHLADAITERAAA